MSDHRYYLSVMTPAASSGDITLEVETYDAEENLTLSCEVTGITTDMTEIDIAKAIEEQLNTTIAAASAEYDGIPKLSSEDYEATFQVTRTEHVLCLWSQAQFSLIEDANTTGNILKLSTTPCLLTVAKARRVATVCGVTLVNADTATAFTSSEIADYIEMACADLIGVLRNNVVISTYLGEFRTNQTKSVQLRPLPLVSIDNPKVRRKVMFERIWQPSFTDDAYNKIKSKGEINFRDSQLFVERGEPFDMDNEVRISYTAGHFHIPTEIQRAVLMIAEAAGTADQRGLKALGGGSLRVEWQDPKSIYYRIFLPVKKFIQGK